MYISSGARPRDDKKKVNSIKWAQVTRQEIAADGKLFQGIARTCWCGDMTGISQYGLPPCRRGPRGARSRETRHPTNAGATAATNFGRKMCQHIPFVTSRPLRFGRFQITPTRKALRR